MEISSDHKPYREDLLELWLQLLMITHHRDIGQAVSMN